MSLEQKIKAILQAVDEGKSAEDLLKAAKDYEDKTDKDIKKDANAEMGQDPDQDGDQDADTSANNKEDDDDASDDNTKLSKSKKDKAEVKEGVDTTTSVPGIGKSLIDQGPDNTSGTEKTAKLVAKYNKGTKQPDMKSDEVKGDKSVDAAASADTAKIKKNYDGGVQPKLKEEAFAALFNGETLTEEFKVKAEAIFEAAVEQVAEAKIEALQEEYQLQLTEAVEEVKGELVEQIDGYLDYIVEKWLEDNAVALESGIKVEMVSSFMEGMKDVFSKHYIDVPESKINVVEEQAKQIEEMESDLVELATATEKALNEIKCLQCEATITSISKGLTALEAEKLYSLAENIDFETEEEFTTKVTALKESYFRKNKSENNQTQASTTILENKVHSDVDAVLKAMKKPLINSSN